MRALTLIPGTPGSARLDELPELRAAEGTVLVATFAIGICGTDEEIVSGKYGWAPPGRERLVLGHESIGRVLEAPAGSGLSEGDWVVGIVRRPDPLPCPNCAVGEWDMCQNGRYTERGIKELDGYGSERYRIRPQFAVKVAPELGPLGVLLEPASVVAKAWEHAERIGARAHWTPRNVFVTGAGPIGLLAAMIGVQRGYSVRVLDRVTSGAKPELVRALGAEYVTGELKDVCGGFDLAFECTGAAPLVFGVMEVAAPNAILCLTGVSSGGRSIPIDVGALNRELVLENNVVFGSVNANRRHYQQAADALARAERSWLERVVTRRVPLARWQEALVRQPGDVKTVLAFAP